MRRRINQNAMLCLMVATIPLLAVSDRLFPDKADGSFVFYLLIVCLMGLVAMTLALLAQPPDSERDGDAN